MVQHWWVATPLGLSAFLLRGVFRRKGARRGRKDEDAAREEGGLSFSCERVCTSDTLLKRLGSLAKARAIEHRPCSLLTSSPPRVAGADA
jgi:hypothetical protein